MFVFTLSATFNTRIEGPEVVASHTKSSASFQNPRLRLPMKSDP